MSCPAMPHTEPHPGQTLLAAHQCPQHPLALGVSTLGRVLGTQASGTPQPAEKLTRAILDPGQREGRCKLCPGH